MSGIPDYVEDPIVHIISITINLVGATFIVKTYRSEIFYGTPGGSPEDADEWFGLTDPSLSNVVPTTSNSGSSSALIKEHDADPGYPVWVVSSFAEGDTRGSVILYSEDGGANWERVFEQWEVPFGDERLPWIFEPTGIVWDVDEKAFFASFHVVDQHADLSVQEGEELYRSSDGRAWSLASKHMRDMGPAITATSDLFAYCNKPENRAPTGTSQKIPDGLQGYNPNSKRFIKPTGLIGFNPYDGARYENALVPTVTIIDESGTQSIKAVDIVDCFAVSYFNNVWIAAGGPNELYIAASFDDGESWTRVFYESAPYNAVTVSGQRVAS